MTKSVLDECQSITCEGWYCFIASPQQFVTLLAALAGIALTAIVIIRLVKAPIADVGSGLAGLMAVGLVLLSLPVISKLSLSFAPSQTVAIEFTPNSNAQKQCSTYNIITEINKGLIERVAQLELKASGRAVVPSAERRKADVRIFFRSGREKDAEKLRLALLPLFRFVDAVNSDLTEVGQSQPTGYTRIRFETVAPGGWQDDAAFVKQITVRELGPLEREPDPVKRSLPGNIQVLLY